METLGITRFEDLIAHLDGLVDAGRRELVDGEAIEFVTRFRSRLVRIDNHLAGRAPDHDPGVQPRSKTVKDTTDFIGQFDRLTDAARGAGLHPTLTHYFHTGRLRLRFALHGEGSRRLINRDEEEATAYLRWNGGQTTTEVVDRSAYGIGVRSRTRLAENTVVDVTLEGQGRRRRWEGLVIHCQPEGGQYLLGLEIFAIKQ